MSISAGVSRRGFKHLVVQKVPDSVHKAGHELRVAEQHGDKPGGPEVLSGNIKVDLVSHRFQVCLLSDMCDKNRFNYYCAENVGYVSFL